MAKMEISIEDTMKVVGGLGNSKIFSPASGLDEPSSESPGEFGTATPTG